MNPLRSWQIGLTESAMRVNLYRFIACLGVITATFGFIFQEASWLLAALCLLVLFFKQNVPQYNVLLVNEKGGIFLGRSLVPFQLKAPFVMTPWFLFLNYQPSAAATHQSYSQILWRDSLNPQDWVRLVRISRYLSRK